MQASACPKLPRTPTQPMEKKRASALEVARPSRVLCAPSGERSRVFFLSPHVPAKPSGHNSGISSNEKCRILRIDCKPALRHRTTRPSWLRYRKGEPASLERAQAGYG